MARVSVTEVLAACAATYRSIDLRMAAVRERDRWVDAFIVIRLTGDSTSAVRDRHKRLEKQHLTMRGEAFRIEFAAYPFSAWGTLCAELAGGGLDVNGLHVCMRSAVDLQSQSGQLRTAEQYCPVREQPLWPSMYVVGGENPVGQLNADNVVDTVRASGYESAYQAIAAFCGADTWPGCNNTYSIVLNMPVFAALAKPSVQGQMLRAEVRRRRGFNQVAVHIVPANSISRVPKGRTTVTRFTRISTTGAIETVAGMAELELGHDDIIELTLAHPCLGALDCNSFKVRAILPAAERNLLLETLKCFCPLEALEDLLGNPGAQSLSKGDQSAAFERHIAWVLSLMGFSPIVLGQHEHLKTGRVQQGSVDIIATRGKCLLLVACTIGAPKSEDFVRLWHLRTVLGQELSKTEGVTICPILVTGITNTEAYWPVEGDAGAIPIIDVHRLRAFVRALPDGTPDRFLQFLDGPERFPGFDMGPCCETVDTTDY